jgi:hypothetical protein
MIAGYRLIMKLVPARSSSDCPSPVDAGETGQWPPDSDAV